MSITVENVRKRFGSFIALDGVSFEVPTGHLVAILGPSGSGKSTVLRVIAGLDSVDEGRVLLDGEDVSGRPARERGVGFVFQHYALFRRMTVRQNIAFGLEVKRLRREEIQPRVDALLDLIQMRGLAERYPEQLSGGQRQRVALARALAPRPRLLLLDEPFGALDAKVRVELRTWLRELHDEFPVTTLFVTHDQEDAAEVSDRIVVMNRGGVEQVGHPREIYDRPSSPFVAEFLGQVNVLRGRSMGGMAVLGQGMLIPTGSPVPDGPVSVYVRAHDLEIQRERHGHPSWPAAVRRLVPIGGAVRLELQLSNGSSLDAVITRDRRLELDLVRGDEVFVVPKEIQVFQEAGVPLQAGFV